MSPLSYSVYSLLGIGTVGYIGGGSQRNDGKSHPTRLQTPPILLVSASLTTG